MLYVVYGRGTGLSFIFITALGEILELHICIDSMLRCEDILL